jgi:hypothetical protein
MAEYKVWRSVLQIHENDHRQAEVIVAAKSRAAAARAFGCSDHDLKNYGGETGNDIQITTAMAATGTVFWKPLNDVTDDYRPRASHTLSDDRLLNIKEKVGKVAAIRDAKKKGKAVWRPFRFGQGSTLTLPGGFKVIAGWKTGGYYEITAGDRVRTIKAEHTEAKIQGVAYMRLLLTAALNALPENPSLEED